MAKLRHVSRKPLYVILVLSLLISIGYVSFRSLYSPQSTQIMQISPVSLEYGHTTLAGRLVKDSPEGKKGSYLLALSDMRLVYLTVEGVDSLVGQNVLVTGILTPSEEVSKPMIMVVEQIVSE